jgi:hypothetical protein
MSPKFRRLYHCDIRKQQKEKLGNLNNEKGRTVTQLISLSNHKSYIGGKVLKTLAKQLTSNKEESERGGS